MNKAIIVTAIIALTLSCQPNKEQQTKTEIQDQSQSASKYAADVPEYLITQLQEKTSNFCDCPSKI